MSEMTERIKAVARVHKLVSVDFIGKNGRVGSKNPVKVRMEFTNGEEFLITYKEFCSFESFPFLLATPEFTKQ